MNSFIISARYRGVFTYEKKTPRIRIIIMQFPNRPPRHKAAVRNYDSNNFISFIVREGHENNNGVIRKKKYIISMYSAILMYAFIVFNRKLQ